MGSDVFNLALDALMIMAITGLWVMWFQQSAQRKKVESMLKDASEDLKAATQLLDQVMQSLDAQGSKPKNTAQTPAEILQQRQMKKDKVQVRKSPVVKKEGQPKAEQMMVDMGQKPKGKTVDTAQIMRFSREGLDEQSIADQLKVPVAQVRLILLLQKPKK
ncbi:DUF6115 domain-containing protein [Ghiorsea bivora]|uniref:DUF6115 domain-containing protein n=1 Tax=Ghiorsea bivora TaxID=1485545 RepID=UPI0005705505|nr:hypothetical protein [Ghiorsea bivora]